jgi:cysteinyl-tRNA synthetase
VTLRLYDTATRSQREFTPLEPGRVSIYLCGLTVQGPPHIGHVRNWVTFDILRRWLQRGGAEVTFVRNVTDIDDKILAKSAAADEPWWQLAFRSERAVAAAEQALGCLPPSYEPRATGHITEMVELMDRLIARGHAYAADGDVYFDVRSFPSYGSLSGQRVDEMLPAGDSVGDDRKHDPRDFALWKAAKPDEPMSASWPTPWGRGRPGWHLECSAMATKYLGPSFDIHGGGLDLVFPHHENELAQSSAAGDGFARYWLHNGLVTMAGEKMSKSLGNTLQVSELAQAWRPVELRYYLGASHYRSTVEYSETSLQEAAAAYGRIENFVQRAVEVLGVVEPAADVPEAFATALDDDLGVPAALAVLHAMVTTSNGYLAEWTPSSAQHAQDRAVFAQRLAWVLAMTDVLGINPLRWEASSDLVAVVDGLVAILLDQRTAARARKDFAAADAVRDQLAAAGVDVEDTVAGSRWTVRASR